MSQMNSILYVDKLRCDQMVSEWIPPYCNKNRPAKTLKHNTQILADANLQQLCYIADGIN